MKKSSTEQRNEITRNIMDKLAEVLSPIFGDIFYTGENFNTITFSAGEVDGKETFGSIKFTLHKANYNLDDEIDKYELFREERELKEKLKAEKKKEQLKKAQEKQAKIAKREQEKGKMLDKTRASIEQMKMSINND